MRFAPLIFLLLAIEALAFDDVRRPSAWRLPNSGFPATIEDCRRARPHLRYVRITVNHAQGCVSNRPCAYVRWCVS